MKQLNEVTEGGEETASVPVVRSSRRKVLFGAGGVFAVLLFSFLIVFGRPFSTRDADVFLYIDNDDNIDSVYVKVERTLQPKSMSTFKFLSTLFSYESKIHRGRYEVSGHSSVISVFRTLFGGRQTPVRIVIPTTWTKEMALGRIAGKLMVDSTSLTRAFNDPNLCNKYNLDTCTIVSVLIPNTYDIYWDISPEEFLERMYEESQKFWTSERLEKAKKMGFSTMDVLTLASIVDAETADGQEKPMVAGLYVNRLHKGMPLQSDPTVKYALGDFELRRVYKNMLRTRSPYNTYINVGLPPSPIRIPTVEGIDAVLNYTRHDYLYMCAKEDLSGTHNFTTSYGEHRRNARNYAQAIDRRNVK